MYGWRLGHEKLLQIALDHFPQIVRYRQAPATLGLFDEESENWTDEDWEHERPNIAETILQYEFDIAIREYLGLGPESDDLINVEVLYDSQRRADFGLTVGSNYMNVIDKEALQKLEALIAPDVPALWFLHCKKWMWRRVVPKVKSKSKQLLLPMNQPEPDIALAKAKTKTKTKTKTKRPIRDRKTAVTLNEPEVTQPTVS